MSAGSGGPAGWTASEKSYPIHILELRVVGQWQGPYGGGDKVSKSRAEGLGKCQLAFLGGPLCARGSEPSWGLAYTLAMRRHHQATSRSDKQTQWSPAGEFSSLVPLGAGAFPDRRKKEHPSLLSIHGAWVGLTPLIRTQPILSSHPPTTWGPDHLDNQSLRDPGLGLLHKCLGKRISFLSAAGVRF